MNQPPPPAKLLRPGHDKFLKHRFDLAGRSWKEHEVDTSLLNPHSRRGSPAIGQDLGSFDYFRLPLVDLGHAITATGEPLSQLFQNPVVEGQRSAKDLCHGCSREVVFRGTQAAAQNDQIGSLQCRVEHRDDISLVVSHDGLEVDVEAGLVESLGEEQGIGVEMVRSQQFGAKRNDLGLHWMCQSCSMELRGYLC